MHQYDEGLLSHTLCACLRNDKGLANNGQKIQTDVSHIHMFVHVILAKACKDICQELFDFWQIVPNHWKMDICEKSKLCQTWRNISKNMTYMQGTEVEF